MYAGSLRYLHWKVLGCHSTPGQGHASSWAGAVEEAASWGCLSFPNHSPLTPSPFLLGLSQGAPSCPHAPAPYCVGHGQEWGFLKLGPCPSDSGLVQTCQNLAPHGPDQPCTIEAMHPALVCSDYSCAIRISPTNGTEVIWACLLVMCQGEMLGHMPPSPDTCGVQGMGLQDGWTGRCGIATITGNPEPPPPPPQLGSTPAPNPAMMVPSRVCRGSDHVPILSCCGCHHFPSWAVHPDWGNVAGDEAACTCPSPHPQHRTG